MGLGRIKFGRYDEHVGQLEGDTEFCDIFTIWRMVMVGLKKCCLVLMVAVVVLSAVATTFAVSAPPPPGHGYLSDRYIILAKVLHVRSQKVNRLITDYFYRVRVLCEYRDQLKPGTTISITGQRAYLQTGSTFIPIMQRGVYFLMGVDRTSKPGVFVYNLDMLPPEHTPIGVTLPSPVRRNAVAQLKQALGYLGHSRPWAKGRAIGNAQAAKLRHSKNYYLWALGTWAIAKSGNRNDVLNLLYDLQRFDSPGFPAQLPPISPRRALWIDYCVRHAAPPPHRPSRKIVLWYLNCYLKGLSQVHEQGYEP